MYSSCFRGARPRRRPASSCCDSLLHILVFFFFSMNTPLHTEGHRWRVTRTLDTGAVQQDIHRSSCKITNKPVSLHVLFVLTTFLFYLFLYVSPTVLYLYLQLCINCSHLLSSLSLRWPFSFTTSYVSMYRVVNIVYDFIYIYAHAMFLEVRFWSHTGGVELMGQCYLHAYSIIRMDPDACAVFIHFFVMFLDVYGRLLSSFRCVTGVVLPFARGEP